jgi:surfeit locus 1 family protein
VLESLIVQIASIDVQFRPGLWPTLGAIAMMALTIHLGQWQQRRAAEKTILQKEFDRRVALPPRTLAEIGRDPEAARYRTLVARGIWRGEGQIYVDNKVENEIAGYHVLTPLQLLDGAGEVLVNRGWVARGMNYPRPPDVPVPGGEVTVTGMAVVPTSRFLELSPASVEGNVWQNLTIARYREASKRDVLPFVLLAQEASPGLVPVTERPDARIEMHQQYMLTWYSLAATTLILWLSLNLKIRAIPIRDTEPS